MRKRDAVYYYALHIRWKNEKYYPPEALFVSAGMSQKSKAYKPMNTFLQYLRSNRTVTAQTSTISVPRKTVQRCKEQWRRSPEEPFDLKTEPVNSTQGNSTLVSIEAVFNHLDCGKNHKEKRENTYQPWVVAAWMSSREGVCLFVIPSPSR